MPTPSSTLHPATNHHGQDSVEEGQVRQEVRRHQAQEEARRELLHLPTTDAYIYKVLKQVHPETGISKRGMSIYQKSKVPVGFDIHGFVNAVDEALGR